MKTVLLSAGDVSGEAHAALLVDELRRRRPELRFVGLGGAAMAAAGVELLADQRDLAIGGLVEVARGLPRVARAWRALRRGALETAPDVVVLVDSGGFNLPFAAFVERRLQSRVLYYAAPQVWAWRPGRLARLARRSHRIAVILPFEASHYAARGVAVDSVGHPLIDRPEWRRPPVDAQGRADARRALGLSGPGPVLALLPGSRRNEWSSQGLLALDTFRALRRLRPSLVALVPRPSSLAQGFLDGFLASLSAAERPALRVVEGASRTVFDAADVALVKPGTATLEASLAGVPMVVFGRVSALTARLARRALRTQYLALPNLLAAAPFVPELLQEAARPEALAAALDELIEDGPARRAQLEGLGRVREAVGATGATARTAKIVEELLDDPAQ